MFISNPEKTTDTFQILNVLSICPAKTLKSGWITFKWENGHLSGPDDSWKSFSAGDSPKKPQIHKKAAQ